jgi:hypothetical protein
MGGYRTAFDPRPSLRNLELNFQVKKRGTSFERSFITKAMLVRLLTPPCRIWSGFMASGKWPVGTPAQLITVIEMARERQESRSSKWLKGEYFAAIQDLAKLGSTEILPAKDREV